MSKAISTDTDVCTGADRFLKYLEIIKTEGFRQNPNVWVW